MAIKEVDWIKELINFQGKIVDDMQDMPEDFAKALRDNFWDLLDDSKPTKS